MMTRRLLPYLALLLSGCTGAQLSYPSLAKRPIESAPVAEATPPPAPIAADAKLAAQISRFTAQSETGRTGFDAAYATAEKAARAATGSSVSSDAWVAAQVAISALETARNDSVSALASLDTLYVDRTSAIADGKENGGLDALDTARTAALAIVDSQNDRIDALKGQLAQP